MQFCKKLDLSICGLLVTTTLFLFPAIIFLVLAFECVGKNNNNVGAEKTKNTDSCALVDKQTVVVLFVFGFLFLFMGVLVCLFAFLVHHTNNKAKRKERSENRKEGKVNFS